MRKSFGKINKFFKVRLTKDSIQKKKKVKSRSIQHKQQPEGLQHQEIFAFQAKNEKKKKKNDSNSLCHFSLL